MVKVSVIIPVYNEERYLQQCLDSLCGQSLEDIEIICVDDGSTDNSAEILEKYRVQDSRIIVLYQKNQYAGVARNNGMKYVTGKYLSFLDSDDYIRPDMLEKMYQEAEDNNLDVVICRYAQYDQRSGMEKNIDWSFVDSFRTKEKIFSSRELKSAGIFQMTKGWAWDKLFKTEFVKQCGYEFPDFRSSEDGFFVYMLMLKAKRISFLEETLIVHRVNDAGSLSNTKEQNWINGFKMLLMIKEEMVKQSLFKIYEKSYLNEALQFMVWYLESMHLIEAYRNCFYYIKTIMEPQLRILNFDKNFYYRKDFYEDYYNIVFSSLEEYLFYRREKNIGILSQCYEIMNSQRKRIEEKGWVFPYHLLKKGKVIVLYGAGKLGRDYYFQLVNSQFCKELIWVDRQYDKYIESEMTIQSPEIITRREFDYIFIAVKDKDMREEIKTWVLGQGVGKEKIKWNCDQ